MEDNRPGRTREGPAFEGKNGDPLTRDEVNAIQSLHRLAKRWPKTLKLVSMGGSLAVVHDADARYHDDDSLVRQEAILDDVHGIPNDGGDW